MPFKHLLPGLLVVLLPAPAWAADISGADIAQKGAPSGAPACMACHGETLQGNPALKSPAIAGLSADYVLKRLEHYASPEGHNALMKQVATTLTPDEKRAVAAYLASLKR